MSDGQYPQRLGRRLSTAAGTLPERAGRDARDNGIDRGRAAIRRADLCAAGGYCAGPLDRVERAIREVGKAMGLTEDTISAISSQLWGFFSTHGLEDQRLREISGQVDARLNRGFEKTTETFTRVLEHLSRIDEAQKKIAELSSSVVSLQEILSDKRSRGAFGEVQLAALVRNLLPESAFSLQQTLPNGTRVDCLLELPEPTGRLAVDAKFPLESYRIMTDPEQPRSMRERSARQFRQDVRKHIADIADRYIIEGETASGAMMFLPAEAVFAEIHAHHPALIEEAQRRGVWLVSPTTMMAILTTTRSVLRDAATQQQVHLIRSHLHALSKDFQRFRERMDKLSRHISLAHQDVADVHRSASKISDRFQRIDDVDVEFLQQDGQG